MIRDEDVILLATEPSEIMDDMIFNDSDEAFIRETNFDQSSLAFIQIRTSGGSSDPIVLGIERVNEQSIRVFTCIGDPSGPDTLAFQKFVLRIDHSGHVPERATVTHFYDSGLGLQRDIQKRTFSTAS
jgi:hypothetical protein